MVLRTVLCAVAVVSFFFPGTSDASSERPSHHRIGLIRQDHVPLRSDHSAHSRVLTILVQQTQVEVLARHQSWLRVRIWASLRGWVEQKEVVFRKPWSTVSTYRAPEIHYRVHASAPAALSVMADAMTSVNVYRAPNGNITATLPAGSRFQVTAWQQDAAGKIWYRARGAWMAGDGVRFESANPARVRSHGRSLWTAVRGKGMWLTLGTVPDSVPETIVATALRHHMTHLYVESAISPLGFHGKDAVGPLIDLAHRHHLAIIAWVYPYLYDVAADVALTRQVASYRTRSGQQFDGIAADLERDIHLWNVRAYSQLVRAYLGSAYLLVGVTYPPQSFPDYPFAEMAHDYNVLAPMDYWHQTTSNLGLDYGHMPYGYWYAYRYAADSVASMRRLAGDVPIAPIGQTFDNFGHLEMGPHAPSADEIKGFLAGSKRSGAAGVSFFQWMTATVPEWRAIHDFQF